MRKNPIAVFHTTRPQEAIYQESCSQDLSCETDDWVRMHYENKQTLNRGHLHIFVLQQLVNNSELHLRRIKMTAQNFIIEKTFKI